MKYVSTYFGYNPPEESGLQHIGVFRKYSIVKDRENELRIDVYLTGASLNTGKKENIVKSQSLFVFDKDSVLNHNSIYEAIRHSYRALLQFQPKGEEQRISDYHPDLKLPEYSDIALDVDECLKDLISFLSSNP